MELPFPQTGRAGPRGFSGMVTAKASGLQQLNENLSLSTQYASSLLVLFSLSGHTFGYFFCMFLDMVSIQLSFLVLCPVCVWFELSWSLLVVLDAAYFQAIVPVFLVCGTTAPYLPQYWAHLSTFPWSDLSPISRLLLSLHSFKTCHFSPGHSEVGANLDEKWNTAKHKSRGLKNEELVLILAGASMGLWRNQ